MASLRYFIALRLPAEPQRVLAKLYENLPGFAWTQPEQLHVTLRFIGDWDDERVPELAHALEQIRVGRFFLPLEGLEFFPPRGDPRVIWVGVGKGHPLLYQLRQRLDDTLLALKFDLDVRTFHPHVTLARLGLGASPTTVRHIVKRHRDFIGPEFGVSSFTLLTSELHPEGSRYAIVEDFPLLPR